MADTDTIARPFKLLLALGAGTAVDRNRIMRFVEVTDDDLRNAAGGQPLDLLGRQTLAYAYKSARKAGMRPGNVYKVEYADDTFAGAYVADARYHVGWPHEEQRVAIRARADALAADEAAAAAAKAENARDPLAESLQAARAAYKGLPAPARAQLLARIVYLITH